MEFGVGIKMENSYKSLEMQIMDLWKSRGMDVDTITVRTKKGKSDITKIIWTITVNLEKSK